MANPPLFHILGPTQTNKPDMTFSTTIGGRTIEIRLKWNERIEFWNMGVFTADGEVIIRGIRTVANIDLFGPYSDERLPPGQLIAFDSENKGADPGRNDWVERHQLLYAEFSLDQDDDIDVVGPPDIGPV